ncbi:MAG: hypothetical protein ACT4P7_22360 [Gemmatimonadaceae bacterium]
MTISTRLHSSAIVALCTLALACSSERGAPNDSAAAAAPPPAPAPDVRMRFDDLAANPGQVRSTPIDGGVHVVTGPALIMYDGADTVSGNYTVQATFKQMKTPTHPEAYGIFAAGTDMTGPKLSYLYFLARGDGKFMVKHRADTATVHTIVDWKANPAVAVQDSAGQATNALTMTFGADSVTFAVNGTQVHSIPRATLESGPDHAGTIGFAGVRVNHNIDVQVTGFRITRM